jgi:RNA polymerase sigma-70 factor (ECF subfamily)
MGVQDAPVATEPGERLDRLHDAYVRTHPRLWRSVLAWSGSRDVADEACAEAFAQAARRGAAVRDVDAWVWRAAFRIAAGELKRRRGSFPGAGRRDGGPDPGDDPTQVQVVGLDSVAASVVDHSVDPDLPATTIDLIRALQSLTEQQRACVVLRDVAGMTAPEAAAALRTTSGTVRVQAMRGRRRLRELLEDHDA